MKICPLGAELFPADGRTDRQTWRMYSSPIAILQTRLNIRIRIVCQY